VGQIRTAEVGDVPQIVEILRQGFPAHLLPYTIFGAVGIGAFLEHAIRDSNVHAGGPFVVSTQGDELAGFAEIRSTADALFLNHIFVRADYQKRGVGSRLLSTAIDLTRGPEHTTICLDVMAENGVARSWYKSVGFSPLAERVWIVRPILEVEAGGNCSWSADGLPQADRNHAVFGFSEFSLTTATGTYRVGRLGDDLFRTTDAKLWLDRSASMALGMIDPRRELLGVFDAQPADELDLGGCHVKALSIRMSASVDDVLAGLGDFV
jgi:ribosomal protein S18 acetylase RimI-like enzyme